ncbi:MAG: class I SAM-dependent methyltransferase [Planctomycetes bacterium]|nr:class I SAM-dependent methyltransferase [Planctomycetota bacterium]
MCARLILLLVSMSIIGHGTAQSPPGKDTEPKQEPFKPRYETRKDHDPDGTGKFYMGREIAQVMGHQGAGWLERPEREREEHCSKMLPALRLRNGDVVADIGAGSGFYTFAMAQLVAPKGKVLAVDIQKEMLAIINYRIRKGKVKNVQPILGTVTNPKLKEGTVDLILLVDVYHEFSHPYEMTVEMVKSLKPKGRIVFVEYRKEDKLVPIKEVHKMYEKQVIREMEPHALRHVETQKHLPWQHIIIFEKIEARKNDRG